MRVGANVYSTLQGCTALFDSMPAYAQYFKQEEIADCYLIIRLFTEGADDEPVTKRSRTEVCSGRAEELAKFPAHRIVLFSSDYFAAQGRNWISTTVSHQQQHGSDPADKPVFSLNISTAEQQATAEAVIAALYEVDTAFSNLQHEQLVHAVILADMINAQEVAKQAACCLGAVIKSSTGLPERAAETLADLTVWPQCLQQLLPAIAVNAACCKLATDDPAAIAAADTNSCMRRMLLTVFGNLQVVLTDNELLWLLSELPLPAMQLLLDSDDLQVSSEDDVLYVAQYYSSLYEHKHLSAGSETNHRGAEYGVIIIDDEAAVSEHDALRAMKQLSRLVRAPYLSDLALQNAALARNSNRYLLGALQALLLDLITLRRFATGALLRLEVHRRLQAPHSWQKNQRHIIAVEMPCIKIKVSVQQLAATCNENARRFADAGDAEVTQLICSSEQGIVLGGLYWMMMLGVATTASGTKVSVYMKPWECPSHVNMYVEAHVVCSATNTDRRGEFVYSTGEHPSYANWLDFWGVGFMPNGWDEAAWVAKGLPLSGDLMIELRHFSVR